MKSIQAETRRVFATHANWTLLLLLGVSVSLATPAFANLLEDGSFDLFGTEKFDFWSIGPKPNDEGVTAIGLVSQDTENGFPKNGSAAKLTFSGSGTYTVIATGADQHMVPMEPGRKYRLTVHAKSGGEPVRIRTEIRPRAEGERERTRTVSLNFKTTEEWQEKTVEWQAKDNETAVNLVFYLENKSSAPATIWLDEVAIDQLPD